ncbi:hypothetical protein [Massilia aurea]|uniref:hypothetical protein n=1 Tax=Massilia aurea TaxID=373040 RepID=UPI0011CD4FD5|nr:hypothetical protein [Massilia aurea]
MTKKSVYDLKSIAAAGGGLILDASSYSTYDLKSIAAAASESGAKIIINNVDTKSTYDLKSIAAAGKRSVIFNLA